MSKDDTKGGLGKLWAGGRESRSAADTVMPLERHGYAEPPDRSYVAFQLRNNAERLHIRRAKDPSRFPAYSYLLDISYDPFHQSAFTLIYSFMVVEVRGWNLEPVVHAISYGDCDRICEFDSRQYDKPAQGEPLIEFIEITVADEKRMK
jgi:hypothetical protein